MSRRMIQRETSSSSRKNNNNGLSTIDGRSSAAGATTDNESYLDLGSFQLTHNDNMTRSEAESTALSSVLPILPSSKVRASAPRADIPSLNHNSIDERRDDATDEYTVETNRPIDSVYIYPSAGAADGSTSMVPTTTATTTTTINNNNNSTSRQRRTTAAGPTRSNLYRNSSSNAGAATVSTATSGLRSIGSGLASSFDGKSAATGSVGGILETLGLSLGADYYEEEDEDVESMDDDESTLGTASKGLSELKSRSTYGNRSGQSSRYHRQRGSNLYNNNNNGSAASSSATSRLGRSRGGRRLRKNKRQQQGPHLHMRAALVLFFLVSILYGAFQWIAMVKANSSLLKHNKKHSKRRNRQYGAFDEGQDRPNAHNLLGKNPSRTAKALAKVPKKDEGPTNLLDKNLLRDKKKSLLLNRDAPQEKAPVDSLASIEKQQKQEARNKESDKQNVLSFAVQNGLSTVYSKDPTHRDLPFLWYIPRSGGGLVKNVLSNCKGLTVASEVGATLAKQDEPKLQVVTVGGHKYVNVDTTTERGIEQAKALGLASSGLANLIVSPRFQEGASLFGAGKKGRAFCMLRHPVERAVSMFYFLKKHNVPALVNMSLESYCKSPHVENNWMVRILSDKMTGEVTEQDLDSAKAVLREKVIIGLLEQKEESMRRFEYHFGWHYVENAQRQTACRTRILVGDYRTNESAKGKIKEGSQAWSLLMWQNKLDMKLYKYAKALFLQQGTELFNDMP